MQQLVISKIEEHDGVKWMECTLTHGNDFENHPDTIVFLGARYDKTSWNSDRATVCYRTH